MRIKQVKISQSSLFSFTNIWLFFLDKPSLNCCRLLVTFQSSEIVNPDKVPGVHIAFMKKIFNDLGSALFLDIWCLTLDHFMMC